MQRGQEVAKEYKRATTDYVKRTKTLNVAMEYKSD